MFACVLRAPCGVLFTVRASTLTNGHPRQYPALTCASQYVWRTSSVLQHTPVLQNTVRVVPPGCAPLHQFPGPTHGAACPLPSRPPLSSLFSGLRCLCSSSSRPHPSTVGERPRCLAFTSSWILRSGDASGVTDAQRPRGCCSRTLQSECTDRAVF